jgi:hypothetical protein
MKVASVILLLVFASISLSGQQYLYIKRKGELPAERLAENAKVKIKIAEQDIWIEGLLKNINTNTITINDRKFYFSNIEAIRLYNPLVRFGGTALWVGGTMFTGIALFNRTINGDAPLLREGQIIFGVSTVSAGFLVRWLSRKTYSKADGYFFEVIDLDHNLKDG